MDEKEGKKVQKYFDFCEEVKAKQQESSVIE